MDSTLDRVEEEYGEEAQNEFEEEDDLISESELNIIKKFQETEDNSKPANEYNNLSDDNERAYQNPLCKPVAVIGNTKIGLSTARLFGIEVDENGKLKYRGEPKKKISIEYYKNIAKPRDIDLSDIPREPEPTFQPVKSKEAQAAMKSKKCGYDFVERLNDRGDFLSRMHQESSTSKGLSKWELESLKNDYEARLDKLMCPSCKKPQSFDEYYEKKRNCSQCPKKFEKLNITSGMSYLKRIEEQEAKKLSRLREVEKEMYGKKATFRSPLEGGPMKKERPISAAANTSSSAAATSKGFNAVPAPVASISKAGSAQPYRIELSKEGVYRRASQEAVESDADIDALVQHQRRLMQAKRVPGEKQEKDVPLDPAGIVKKMVAINQKKHDLIDKTLSSLLDKQSTRTSTANPSTSSGSSRPLSAPATRRSKGNEQKERDNNNNKDTKKQQDLITQKFQRLVS
mmetsp:Transcript_32090/g.46253  ORF Transcript_32090/g.46253 Transcript_32090/m.46253 type:complete len:458 (-) Transcript_32090:1038-2411(-)|eukprot:CAMPEP_0170103418 /NCGR_PEP_ID=MMETSP0020_2-20130122/3482_1 /TAXON_ID=98059 /ORGANISM="Dinobryon sp., Strain UTEXLB2267" /LENGTH=457 /DNA_ID=CAMNT_0010326981 /DNA_START=60 /DNA_END=1433 /DNA_ORIENTATION=-